MIPLQKKSLQRIVIMLYNPSDNILFYFIYGLSKYFPLYPKVFWLSASTKSFKLDYEQLVSKRAIVVEFIIVIISHSAFHQILICIKHLTALPYGDIVIAFSFHRQRSPLLLLYRIIGHALIIYFRLHSNTSVQKKYNKIDEKQIIMSTDYYLMWFRIIIGLRERIKLIEFIQSINETI